MTREELFAIWAPAESVWTPWAKAVVFAHWSMSPESAAPAGEVAAADAAWLPGPRPMAVVVDLPGAMGVAYGLRLAQSGYRPVPLYSAAPWPQRFAPMSFDMPVLARIEMVDVRSILAALVGGAERLSQIRPPADAPPAFLLDANRRSGPRPPQEGDFDNRSISLPTDFPSASLLSRHGLRTALLIQSHGQRPQADLVHTLGRWNKQGMEILCRPMDGVGEPATIRVKPPGAIVRFFYGIFGTVGFRRNALGGFGGVVSAVGSGG